MLHRPLTKELQEKARNELNETEQIREDNLKELKKWLGEQQFSNEIRSDLWLLNYLRGCKFNQEKAREKLFHYFSIKSNKHELFQTRDPSNEVLQKVISQGILLLIPAEEMETILVRWENCDKNSPMIDVIKLGLMLFDIYINESNTCMVLGHNVIIDCKHIPFCYLRQITPSLVKEIACVILKAYPPRIKAVHVINCFSFISILFSIFKAVLPKKIISRIHFYGSNDIDKLCKNIPLSVLPKEYGGAGESVHTLTDLTKNILEERRTWFLDQEEEHSSCTKSTDKML